MEWQTGQRGPETMSKDIKKDSRHFQIATDAAKTRSMVMGMALSGPRGLEQLLQSGGQGGFLEEVT